MPSPREPALALVLPEWLRGCGQIDWTVLAAGADATTLALSTPLGEFVAKTARSPSGHARLTHEARLLHHLAACPWAPPVRSTLQHTLETGVLLLDRLPGTTPLTLNRDRAQAVARILEQVHDYPSLPEPSPLPPQSMQKFWLGWLQQARQELQSPALAQAARVLDVDVRGLLTLLDAIAARAIRQQQHFATGTVGLSHSDVVPGNLLVDGDNLVLLDWEWWRAQDGAFDLAQLAMAFDVDVASLGLQDSAMAQRARMYEPLLAILELAWLTRRAVDAPRDGDLSRLSRLRTRIGEWQSPRAAGPVEAQPAATQAALPRCDLHVHLLGAIDGEIAAQIGFPRLLAPPSGANLQSLPLAARRTVFFNWFRELEPIYRDPGALAAATLAVGQKLVRDGVQCGELRFSPIHYLDTAQDPHVPLRGIAERLAEVERGAAIVLSLVASIPQQRTRHLARLTDACVEAWQSGLIAGLDFHGDEAHGDNAASQKIWQRLAGLGVPFSVHAGEFGQPEAVARAVDAGAKRIGHALGLAPGDVCAMQSRGVAVEVCLTSSWLLAGRAPADHPIVAWLDAGLEVVLGTDDPAVFATSLLQEMALARALPGWNHALEVRLARTSCARAFLSPQQRARLQHWLASALSEPSAGQPLRHE